MLGEFVVSFTSIPFFLTKIIAVFFCGIELISMNENIRVIKGINLFATFKKMLSRTKEIKDDIVDIGTIDNCDESKID